MSDSAFRVAYQTTAYAQDMVFEGTENEYSPLQDLNRR